MGPAFSLCAVDYALVVGVLAAAERVRPEVSDHVVPFFSRRDFHEVRKPVDEVSEIFVIPIPVRSHLIE